MFATLAGSGGMPTASKAGYETKDMMPPAVPIIPASAPAPSRTTPPTAEIKIPPRAVSEAVDQHSPHGSPYRGRRESENVATTVQQRRLIIEWTAKL